MLRVTSGTVKGKKLRSPQIDGFRATQDKVKLAIFSILGEKVAGANCLDLYAGSGSLGIEALSRGAATCAFVDDNWESEQTVRENLQNTGFTDRAEVYRTDAVKFVANAHESYDIVFADPFYKDTHFKFLFENLQEILNPGGTIIFSHGKETDVQEALSNSPKLALVDTRRYGSAFISTIKLQTAN